MTKTLDNLLRGLEKTLRHVVAWFLEELDDDRIDDLNDHASLGHLCSSTSFSTRVKSCLRDQVRVGTRVVRH